MKKKRTDMKNGNSVDEKENDWGEVDKLAEVVAKNLIGLTREEILKTKSVNKNG
ncbi:MAG: hypothetical protein OXI01_24150 [Albidovulum sp.]|nr:hypothetical protein [Albidovulum sp.]